ncbi:class I SAM-dependent methyltransferase [Methylomicrobium sp. Wu6]|uniref:class I SAM-dependent methyltransferase n=1 Tax=Methylomicrobium sp. Wu6 TaxID=3107928 RepID=UPI002DD64EAA|nr:class I SAM-dependent methyltransferase [Methylomicrobium sp. Wu6]MEC4749580.1 class I SAM-dependent methyltransferase [Methylomicrobium sp. Wu6]
MSNFYELPEPIKLDNWHEEKAVMAAHIREVSGGEIPLQILEAGCGTSWGLDLKDIPYILSGIDLDQHALDLRQNQEKDLDIGIYGDLRTVMLEEGKYDVIFNSYVLEHVSGAEDVLINFVRWLKPGGILVLVIPNRDSVWGFMTRMTPFWFHVFFRKFITGDRDAGKPGYAPYPTFYDKVVSRKGVYAFCKKHRLSIQAEYSVGHGRRNKSWGVHALLVSFIWMIHFASLKTLSAKHANLIYIIKKSPEDP